MSSCRTIKYTGVTYIETLVTILRIVNGCYPETAKSKASPEACEKPGSFGSFPVDPPKPKVWDSRVLALGKRVVCTECSWNRTSTVVRK